MALPMEYKLPGVYSRETTGPRLNTTTGGAARVAFIGASVGYRQATQRLTLEDEEYKTLNYPGVIADSYEVRGALNNKTYTLGKDYTVEQDVNGKTKIKRNIRQLSTEKKSESGREFTYFAAQPDINILTTPEGDPIEGYVVQGTVTVANSSGDLDEGTDYEIDYYTNNLLVKAGGAIENGDTLTVSYDWTTAEPLELTGEITADLSHKYISKDGLEGAEKYTASIVSGANGDNTYGATPGASDGYVEGVDYVIDYNNGKIQRTATSRIPSFDESEGSLFYIAYGYSGIKSGESLIVNYHYKDEHYNQAKLFNDYNEMIEVYGAPWNTDTGEVQSPITLAAYIASKNGMSSCYAVAVEGVYTSDNEVQYPIAAWDKAFQALTVVDGIDIVVPVSGDPAIIALAQEHLNAMKANQDERVAIVGMDGTETPLSMDYMVSQANGVSSPDVWIVAPSTFKFRNPINDIVEVVPGYYAAAAVAGLNSSISQSTPITQKSISGLFSSNERHSKIEKKNAAANGLIYIDEVDGALRILHGRTTSTAGLAEQETNVVLTKYYIIKTMRESFSHGYIGSIITDSTLLQIKSAAFSVLCNFRDNDYLTNFTGPEVEVDSTNQSQVNITFSYVPAYGMNYIEIEFSVDAAA